MTKLIIKIRLNAIKDKNGMVIKPNQLIYWPVQGTNPQESSCSLLAPSALNNDKGQ